MDNQRSFANWNIGIIHWRVFQNIFNLKNMIKRQVKR